MSNIVISPESGILEFNYNPPSGAAIGDTNASIRLDATGGQSWLTGTNVGIGTTGPSDFHSNANRLVVGDGAGAEGITIFSQDNNAGYLYFADGTAGDAAYRGFVQYSHSTNNLSLGTAGGTKLTIASDGKVRIGTYTEASQGGQTVFGNLSSFANSDTDNIFLGLKNGSYPNRGFAFRTVANGVNSDFTIYEHGGGSAEVFRITSAGVVGIGTTNPGAQFFGNLVVGNNDAGDKGITIRSNAGNKGVLAFSDTDAADANRYDGYIAYDHTNQDMFFYADGANERFRIDSVGARVNGILRADVLNTKANDGNIIYRSDSRTFVGNAGNNSLIVLDDGKVGMGTTVPVSKLTVESSANALADVDEPENHHLLLRNPANDTTEGVGMGFLVSAATSDVGAAIVCKRIGDNAQSELQFWNKQNTTVDGVITQSMTISEEGNVGIGTNDPSRLLELYNDSATVANNSQLRIHNAGAGDAYIYLYAGSDWSLGIDNSDTDKFKICTSNDVSDGNSAITIDRNGKVGIGTDTPSQKLFVNGRTILGGRGFSDGGAFIAYATLSETNGGAATLLGNAVYAGTASNTYRKIYNDAGNFIRMTYNKGICFHTNVTGNAGDSEYPIAQHEQMRIELDGNVGIGTTNPTAKLQVQGTAKVTAHTDLQSTVDISNDTRIYTQLGIGDSNWITPSHALEVNGDATFAQYLYHRGDEDTNIKFLDDDFIINVGGAAFFRATETTQNTIKLNSDNEDTDFYLYGNHSTPAMFMRGSDREIGINTTNPTASFHVVGNARIKGASSDGVLSVENAAGSQTLRIDQNSIRTSTDNNLTFLTNGNSNSLVLQQSTNHVGIGTNDPATKLEVIGVTTSKGFRTRTDNGDFNLISRDNDLVALYIQNARNNTDQQIASFRCNSASAGQGTEIFRVAKDKSFFTNTSVGIGTNSPAQKLEVVGQAIIDGGVGVDSSATLHLRQKGDTLNDGLAITSSHATSHRIWKDGNGKLNIGPTSLPSSFVQDLNGNVGIGTTNPAAKLTVQGDNADFMVRSNDYTISRIIPRGDTSSNWDKGLFSLMNASTEAVRIDSASSSWFNGGNVGIGTDGPAALLHVYNSAGPTIRFERNSTSKLDWEFGTANISMVGGGELQFRANGGTSNKFVINNSLITASADLYVNADVGIGTNNPEADLSIVNTAGIVGMNLKAAADNICYIDFGDSSDNNIGGINYSNINDTLNFRAGNANKVTIDSAGKVGIGSASPQETLDVVGLIRFAHTRSDNTQKIARLLVPEYNNSHGQFLSFMGTANETSNAVSYGGGTSSADAATVLLFYTASNVNTVTGTERMRIASDGNVGIGTNDPGDKLQVNGSFSASSKTFNIEHPTQSGKRLIHGCFEGPEHGVYFRGKSQDSLIEPPEYWSGLVDIESMTVDVTPIGPNQSIYVDRIDDNGNVYVGANTNEPLNYFYVIYGERKDVDKLEVVKDILPSTVETNIVP